MEPFHGLSPGLVDGRMKKKKTQTHDKPRSPCQEAPLSRLIGGERTNGGAATRAHTCVCMCVRACARACPCVHTHAQISQELRAAARRIPVTEGASSEPFCVFAGPSSPWSCSSKTYQTTCNVEDARGQKPGRPDRCHQPPPRSSPGSSVSRPKASGGRKPC